MRLPVGSREGGFSLVEVILSLGLLGAVLISVSGLFLVGNKMLLAGKHQTIALSIGRDIIEEMNGWSFADLWARYGEDGSASSIAIDSRTNAYAAKWQEALASLPQAHARIDLDAVEQGGILPAIDSAEVVRVRVTIEWRDGLRERRLALAAARL